MEDTKVHIVTVEFEDERYLTIRVGQPEDEWYSVLALTYEQAVEMLDMLAEHVADLAEYYREDRLV